MLVLEPGQSLRVVDGATVVGVGASLNFTVRPRPDGPPTVEFQPTLTGPVTAFVARLESSTDGGVTFVTYPGGDNLNFVALPVQQVLNLVPGQTYRINIRTLADPGTRVILNATTAGVPGGLVEFRKLEYERAATRYNNVYESMWQIFSYMTAITAAILTFGADRFQVNFLGVLACLPLVFWFWASYLPLDSYGRDCLSTLTRIEHRINIDWPGARLSHYERFQTLTVRGRERVRVAIVIAAILLHATLLWNLHIARTAHPWMLQKSSETKVTITNLDDLRKIGGQGNTPLITPQNAP